jgi:methyl-accepting chemotaxis protein
MLARLRRMSMVTRILAVATLSLVVLSGTLFVVVKQTVETTTFEQTKAEVIHAEGMLHYLADQKGPPAIVHGQLVFGHWVAYHNYSIVDAVKHATGATASMFQLRPDGKLVRVATNVPKADGTRAVGTILQGPAAAAFARGENYIGINPILGRPYVTEYDIIRNAAGRPVGILYTGVPMTTVEAATGQIVVRILLTAVLGLLISLALFYLLTRPIVRALQRLTAAATRVASGETNVVIDVGREDELGLLARSFRSMVRHLVQAETEARLSAQQLERGVTQLIEEMTPATEGDLTIRPQVIAEAGDVAVVADFTGVLITSFADVARLVRDAAQQVHVTSDRLTARVQDLLSEVQERGVQVNETAALAEQIAEGATDVLGAVDQVNRSTRDAVASVDQGNRAVAQTLERMDAMRGTMIQATRQIKKLSDSSLAMNGTVGLVLQFAGDLELLADNAQIEAARHEAGGVFTAVAEQTGRLAEDAQKALTDIQAAVLTNRQETAEVGRQMEQVATEVVAGVRAVEEARTAFEDITRSVRELDGFVERVNTVASGQVQVATAVSTAMAQIMTFFAQIAAGVRLSERDATELRLTIDNLRNSIANLKLAADEPDAARAADHVADRLRDRAVA